MNLHFCLCASKFQKVNEDHTEFWWIKTKCIKLCLSYLFFYSSFFKIYFIDYAITVVPIPTHLFPSALHTLPTHIPAPAFSSCSWVIHISSLASLFPILFLTSPCLFFTYHVRYLFSVPCLSLPLILPHW